MFNSFFNERHNNYHLPIGWNNHPSINTGRGRVISVPSDCGGSSSHFWIYLLIDKGDG